jgi:hypothetical protein
MHVIGCAADLNGLAILTLQCSGQIRVHLRIGAAGIAKTGPDFGGEDKMH